ncbi:MAG: hypothetical protein RLY78_3621 [Pseudomonadota bacterium]|jgi:spermidine synthase
MRTDVPLVGSTVQEWLRSDFGYQLSGLRWIDERQTPFQWLQLGEHPWFGKVLRLDGAFQCSERDECCYHEPLIHTALAASATQDRVLVVGGGDGGAAEEALKWPTVQWLDQVEIDAEVVAIARQHLRGIHRGVLDGGDPRMHLHIGDGLAWLRGQAGTAARYDTIILDLTDAGGPSSALWQRGFYQLCARRLKPGGRLTLHIAAPMAQLDTCVAIVSALQAVFAEVRPFLVNVPLSGGAWMMALCGHSASRIDARHAQTWLDALAGPSLQCLDGAMMAAQFALPPALQRALTTAPAAAPPPAASLARPSPAPRPRRG